MAEVREVTVPDIGDFSDVPVIEVLVEPGQEVAEEDPLVTLESDKATMDVPAPFAGVIKDLKISVGDKVSEGTAILTIEVSEDGAGPPDTGEGTDTGQAAAEKTAAPEAEPGADAAVAAGASEREERPPEPPPARGYGDVSAEGDDEVPEGAGPHASPSVRRLARELDVDLSSVRGRGRKGRVTKEDLKAHLAGRADGGGVPLGLPPWPQVDFEKFGEVERVPLPRIKKISGPNIARNWVTIPHVTQFDEADITELEAFRKQVNAEQDKAKVTMVALLMKACVAVLKEFPDFNASLDGDQLVLKRYYHLGFAADTPGGLVVPVIRDVDRKGLLEVAIELRELSGRAREGKLKPTEMQGSTFTISSLGGIGGTAFTPIINAPEVAILGVSRSVMKPVWNDSEFTPRLIVPLSLSYDHRVIDGAAAARFTTYLAGVLSDLRRVLL